MESGWKAILGHLASTGNECVLNNKPRIHWLFISHKENTFFKMNFGVYTLFCRVQFEFCRKNLGTSSLPKKRVREQASTRGF